MKLDTPKNLLPHSYINNNASIIIGSVVNYIEKVSNPLVSNKRKYKESNDRERYEEDIFEAVESNG